MPNLMFKMQNPQDLSYIQEGEINRVILEESAYIPVQIFAKIQRLDKTTRISTVKSDGDKPSLNYVHVPSGNLSHKMFSNTALKQTNAGKNDDRMEYQRKINIVTLTRDEAMRFGIDVDSSCVCSPTNSPTQQSSLNPFHNYNELSEGSQDYAAGSSSRAGGGGYSKAQSESGSSGGGSESSSLANSGAMGGLIDGKSGAKSGTSSSGTGQSGGGSGSNSMASSGRYITGGIGSSASESFSGSGSKSGSWGDGRSNSFSFSSRM